MSRKNRQDNFNRSQPDDLEQALPVEDAGGYEDEQSYGFGGEYMTPDADAPEANGLRQGDAEGSGKNAANGLVPRPDDKPAKPKKLTRKDKKFLAAIPEQVIREAPTVGRSLRADQMLVYDSELDEVDYTDPDDLPEMRDYLPIRFRRYGRSGLGGGLLYAAFVISLSIILACFAWMCAVDVLALNKESSSAVVTILPYEPTGDMPVSVTREDENGDPIEIPIQVDIDQVAEALKNGGIIEYKWLFKLYSRFSHANVKIDAGTYDLNTSLDYMSLVNKMQFGSDSQEITRVTFPEGFTTEQIFTLLEQNYICKKADLYEAAANHEFKYDFLDGIPLGDPTRLDGFLFPDTYEFYQGESAAVAINRFLNNMNNKLTSEIRRSAEQQGKSIREIIIMASLIEKEAGNTEEMPTMAGVIYNRLNAGWKLQLDSTVNFVQGTSTFDLTDEDLKVDSPYNTYVYEGLPIGPICSPGLAAIQAAVAPERTNYWYWYAVDGESTFFATYDEQQAFAAAHPY